MTVKDEWITVAAAASVRASRLHSREGRLHSREGRLMSYKRVSVTLQAVQWEAILRGLANAGYDAIHQVLTEALAIEPTDARGPITDAQAWAALDAYESAMQEHAKHGLAMRAALEAAEAARYTETTTNEGSRND